MSSPIQKKKPLNKIININGVLFVEKPDGTRTKAKPATVEKFKHKLTTQKAVPQPVLVKTKASPKQFRPRVKSRHPTHKPLRTELPYLPFRATIRLGSTLPDDTSTGPRIVCNPADAINRSANKLLMKQAFEMGNVKTAGWCSVKTGATADLVMENLGMDEFAPVVSKLLNGSRGLGNKLHRTKAELSSFLSKNSGALHNYIFERFHDYNREYRLHVTRNGCFYTCRKMLKSDTPEDKRWFRNDSNCTWAIESNPNFDKPINWKEIEEHCVKALNAVGLDVGACDVKVQSAKDSKGNIRKNPEFIVIEINSAPSFGEITTQKYLQVLPEILKSKKNAVG